MSINVATSDGREAVLSTDELRRFEASLEGRVLTAESGGYHEGRTVWNAMIDRRPAAIVQCATPDDVARAVRLCAEHGLVVAVKGGGHNIAGNALCDGGLVIDLGPMKAVRVDPAARTATVEAGATLADFDGEAQRFALATPLGINSTTGVAGLTLGGGFGWLSRGLGLTIDNLIAADVVTAAGERLRASTTEHADLFWGIRGGGGNFGVVTSFEFALHDVGPNVLSGLIVHPLADAAKVLRFHREFFATAPEELVCWAVLRQAPPLPVLPVEWHGKEILALALCYRGPIEEGDRAMKPLRDVGRPIADLVGPQPYAVWQTALDPMLGPGMRNYWKSHDFSELSDGLIDVLVDYARRLPDPQTDIALAQLGGAVRRVPDEATAYGHRAAEYVLNVHGRWADPALDDACIGWARELFQATAPFSNGGVYVNFLTQEEGERVPAAYGPNYARLVALKSKFDPTNLFRVNQNIRPSLARAAAG